eukprot:tig00021319_g20216.t1
MSAGAPPLRGKAALPRRRWRLPREEALLAVLLVLGAYAHTTVNRLFVSSSFSAEFFDPLIFFLVEALAVLCFAACAEACRRWLRLREAPELSLEWEAFCSTAPGGWWYMGTVLLRSSALAWAESATWTSVRGFVPLAVVGLGAAINGEVPSGRGGGGAALFAAALACTWRPAVLVWRADEVAGDVCASLFAALHAVFSRKALARCSPWTVHVHQTAVAAGGVLLLRLSRSGAGGAVRGRRGGAPDAGAGQVPQRRRPRQHRPRRPPRPPPPAALSAWRVGVRGALKEVVGAGEEAAVEISDLVRAAAASLALAWATPPGAPGKLRSPGHVRNKSDELAVDGELLPARALPPAPRPPPRPSKRPAPLRIPYSEPVGRAPLAALRRLRYALGRVVGPWLLSPRGERRLRACHSLFWGAVFLAGCAFLAAAVTGGFPSLRAAPGAARPRAVITFMLHPERLEEFLGQALPRLDAFFNARFRYPLLVFEQGLTPEHKARIRAATPAHVSFYHLRFEMPPGQEGVRMEASCGARWGMGYRHMCRFHAFAAHKVVAALGYEWYWRLDTDARLHAPVARDPFVAAREAGLRYAFANWDWDTADCVVGFWKATRAFLASVEEDGALAAAAAEAGAPLRLPATMLTPDGEWNRLIVYNNLEIARADFFDTPLDAAYFRHVDATRGILQWRWGDAGIHTLAAFLFHPREQVGLLEFVHYNHHRRRAPPASARITELASHASW